MPLAMRLEQAIVARLRVGEAERYELDPGELPALSRILQARLRKPTASEELLAALKLAEAMEETLESPSAARAIIELLRSEPEAVALIRKRILRNGAIDEMRMFQKREGRLDPPAAPTIEATREISGIKLSRLLDERCARSRRMVGAHVGRR